MSPQLSNIVFIIWRESVEALLVVGVLNAWLQRQGDRDIFVQARRYLWGGVVTGVALAIGFAALLIGFGDALPDEAQKTYQAAAVLMAAGLIVQMVIWMRRNGCTLRRTLEASLGAAANGANWWSLFILALIAVAREGSETAVFLYGTLATAGRASLGTETVAVATGLVAAGATYWALQVGGRYLSWRVFFRGTEIMLLFLAGSLVLTGIGNLADLGMLPDSGSLMHKAWDSSALLSDGGPVGGLVSALTGYRARPVVLDVLTYAAYWILVLWLLSSSRLAPVKAA